MLCKVIVLLETQASSGLPACISALVCLSCSEFRRETDVPECTERVADAIGSLVFSYLLLVCLSYLLLACLKPCLLKKPLMTTKLP